MAEWLAQLRITELDREERSMSLQANDDFWIPAETVRVAFVAAKGNVYLRMRDELGVWCHDGDFADLLAGAASRRKRRGGWRW